MVWMWLTNWQMDTEEIEFEHEVNPNWEVVFKNMFTWLRQFDIWQTNLILQRIKDSLDMK